MTAARWESPESDPIGDMARMVRAGMRNPPLPPLELAPLPARRGEVTVDLYRLNYRLRVSGWTA